MGFNQLEDMDIICEQTPVVFATRVNETMAEIKGLPQIYHKVFDLNELIGEELAGIRGIKSAHYFPVMFQSRKANFAITNYFEKCDQIRIGSFDFKKTGISYISGSEFAGAKYGFDFLLSFCPNEKNRQTVINELLEIYALDIYSSQGDRPGNLYFEVHPNGEIHVAEMFDYEQSLEDDIFNYYYASDFHRFDTVDDYQKFIKQYPQLREMLKSYLDLDLMRLIKRVGRSRRFDLSKINLEGYARYSEVAQKKKKKILE